MWPRVCLRLTRGIAQDWSDSDAVTRYDPLTRALIGNSIAGDHAPGGMIGRA